MKPSKATSPIGKLAARTGLNPKRIREAVNNGVKIPLDHDEAWKTHFAACGRQRLPKQATREDRDDESLAIDRLNFASICEAKPDELEAIADEVQKDLEQIEDGRISDLELLLSIALVRLNKMIADRQRSAICLAQWIVILRNPLVSEHLKAEHRESRSSLDLDFLLKDLGLNKHRKHFAPLEAALKEGSNETNSQ